MQGAAKKKGSCHALMGKAFGFPRRANRPAREAFMKLLAQAELFHDGTISFDIDLLQIAQQASSVTDHLQKTATAVVVLLVLFQMLVEMVDSPGEQSDLYLGRARVAFVNCVGFDDLLFDFWLHCFHLIVRFRHTPEYGG